MTTPLNNSTMKAFTTICALALAGTCASRPLTGSNTVEAQTAQRAPAAFPTNSAGEMVLPHGMNGHTMQAIPTAAATHLDPVPILSGGPILESREGGPFPPLSGAKNSTVDVPDHGHLPPYTGHHARDDGAAETADHRHLPSWEVHHEPRRNESAEVVVDHRRLPSWVLNPPTSTLVAVASGSVAPVTAS
ncbi:hypothetical protein MMC26_004931 [Xylographa opegraphella]|nr:hypothetical protein [Xylographa opegraphella]